jgi:HEAT repeat protein
MTRNTPDFASILNTLGTESLPISAETVYGLSALDRERLSQLEQHWTSLSPARRRKLLQLLNDSSEANFEMDFRDINHFALKDPDSEVRQYAIEGLWEDESLHLMHKLIQAANHDPSLDVRCAAVTELGRFLLLGEYGDIPDAQAAQARESVLNALHMDEEPELRRRALEAIANSSHEGVRDMIDEFYNHEDLRMRMSAVFAMGRTCDQDWAPEILQELQSQIPEMRYEAARAAGHTELAEAIPYLLRVIDETDDVEILEISIWALGEIGGDRARKALTEIVAHAEAQGDEQVYDAAREALDAASLPGDLMLFDFEP